MHSGLCDWKINRKIPRKKSKHAKVLLLHDNISEDVEFLEVALDKILLKNQLFTSLLLSYF